LGNSSNSKRIFTLQKKIIRIIAGTKPRNLCRRLFKKLEILSLPREKIISLMNFIINNHSVITRNKNHLHRPTANISCLQKGAYYAGIKIFNSPPHSLKTILNKKKSSIKKVPKHTHLFILLMNSCSLKRTHNPFRGYCTYIL
jgi:hypothetical protein